jgi:2-keto-4-pentenoate hydratase/2-oxohepta-3-ene-1,7-dioic acid hydratase in catechol pathway
MGQKPPTYLRPGQTVSLGIAGLGEQTHEVVAAE